MQLEKYRALFDVAIAECSKKTKSSAKKKGAWRIKIDGEFITTSSNKTVWKTGGHAKSALRLHFETCKYEVARIMRDDKTTSSRAIDAVYETQYQKYITEHVEFIELKEDTQGIYRDKIKNAYIYDDRCKSKEELKIENVIAVQDIYLFVLLENKEVGMINTKTSDYTSDKRAFYRVEW